MSKNKNITPKRLDILKKGMPVGVKPKPKPKPVTEGVKPGSRPRPKTGPKKD